MHTCVPICGCEKDGVVRVDGQTKEEWLELKQDAMKKKRLQVGKKKPEMAAALSDSVDMVKKLKTANTPANPTHHPRSKAATTPSLARPLHKRGSN